MDSKQIVILALQVSILATVFGFGLKATSGDVMYLVRRPGLLLRSLLAVFVIMPVIAVVLSRFFDFRQVTEIALVALAISPIPPLLPNRETKAGGRTSYALGLMALLALLAIAFVPTAVWLLGRVFGREFTMPPGTIARVVLVGALLPLAAGMIVRATLPTVAARIDKPVALVAMVLLPLAVLGLLAGTWQAVWAAVGDGTVLAIVAFVAAGLLVGHLMGGPDPEESAVLALSSACRHPAIAFSIASANFPDERFGGTILLYLIMNIVIGIPYIAFQRRQNAGTVSPA